MTVQDWLGKDNQLGIDIWEKKYRNGEETFEQWLDRVSNGNKPLRQLIMDKKFLFGGRTLSNRGVSKSGTYFNCYSLGYIEDDYKQILQAAMDMGLTYKAQGGQGVSLTKIRPLGTPIGTRYKSDGIVPFMRLYNSVTTETSQGGARKGALMISLDIRHKEAETFITLKNQGGVVEKANLSLEIDDEFMKAVKTYYDTGKEIVLHEIRDYGVHHIEYDIIPIKLYKLLVQNCYDWGDPACLFTNKFRNYNLMEFDGDYQVETSNPCGEQPLPKNFCCNLGSLNLSAFVKNPFTEDVAFNIKDFLSAVEIAVGALDELVDENADNHPLEAQKVNSLNYRNIGLGITGYGTTLMKMGIKYGSNRAKEFTDFFMSAMFLKAVRSSSRLAAQKGSFPKYKDVLFNSTIIEKHFDKDEVEELKSSGIRNCSLLSFAPAGTLSLLFNVTSGIEPEFSISYKRKTESLIENEPSYYDVYCNAYTEYKETTGRDDMPDYFITAQDVPWRDRIDIQSIMQQHIDTAISSTINLKEDAKIEDVEKLYLYAWEQGLKGITIFRDGCKRLGILTTDDKAEKPKEHQKEELDRGFILDISNDVVGKKRKLMTGCGSLHCVAFFDPQTGNLLETYLSKGSTGGCQNFMVGLSRMISLSARAGCDINSIVNQLDSCGVCPSYSVRSATKHDTSKGSCCPMAIGNALIEMHNEMLDEIGVVEREDDYNLYDSLMTGLNEAIEIETISKDVCPDCGEPLIFEGGCNTCKNCGWSKCT